MTVKVQATEPGQPPGCDLLMRVPSTTPTRPAASTAGPLAARLAGTWQSTRAVSEEFIVGHARLVYPIAKVQIQVT